MWVSVTCCVHCALCISQCNFHVYSIPNLLNRNSKAKIFSTEWHCFVHFFFSFDASRYFIRCCYYNLVNTVEPHLTTIFAKMVLNRDVNGNSFASHMHTHTQATFVVYCHICRYVAHTHTHPYARPPYSLKWLHDFRHCVFSSRRYIVQLCSFIVHGIFHTRVSQTHTDNDDDCMTNSALQDI